MIIRGLAISTAGNLTTKPSESLSLGSTARSWNEGLLKGPAEGIVADTEAEGASQRSGRSALSEDFPSGRQKMEQSVWFERMTCMSEG